MCMPQREKPDSGDLQRSRRSVRTQVWDVSHRWGAGKQGGCSSLYRVAPLSDDHVPVFTAAVQVQRSPGIEGCFSRTRELWLRFRSRRVAVGGAKHLCFAQSLLWWSYKSEEVASGSIKSKENLLAVGGSFLRSRPEIRIGKQVVYLGWGRPQEVPVGEKGSYSTRKSHWERVCYKAYYYWVQRSMLSPQNSGKV